MYMEKFETSDLYLTAYLKSKGMKMVGTKKGGRRVTFIFEDNIERQTYVDEFFNHGTVDITDFKNIAQDLKTLIFNT